MAHTTEMVKEVMEMTPDRNQFNLQTLLDSAIFSGILPEFSDVEMLNNGDIVLDSRLRGPYMPFEIPVRVFTTDQVEKNPRLAGMPDIFLSYLNLISVDYYRGINLYDRNRRLVQKTVSQLAEILEDGKWVEFHPEALSIASYYTHDLEEGYFENIFNGRHRVVAFGKAIQENQSKHVDTEKLMFVYRYRMEDADLTISPTVDIHRKRTATDLFHIAGHDVNGSAPNLVRSVVKGSQVRNSRGIVSDEDIMDIYEDYEDEFSHILNTLKGAKRKKVGFYAPAVRLLMVCGDEEIHNEVRTVTYPEGLVERVTRFCRYVGGNYSEVEELGLTPHEMMVGSEFLQWATEGSFPANSNKDDQDSIRYYRSEQALLAFLDPDRSFNTKSPRDATLIKHLKQAADEEAERKKEFNERKRLATAKKKKDPRVSIPIYRPFKSSKRLKGELELPFNL